MSECENCELGPFSEQFSKQLFERYPEWKQYMVLPNPDWQSAKDMSVEVPSRFAPYCPLRIETMYDEIIISWAGWHIHSDDGGGAYDEEQIFTLAFDIIDGLLSERRVVIETWSDGPGGTGGNIPPEEVDEQLRDGFWSRIARDHNIVVLSWNGTYDRGGFDPEKC